MHTRWAFSLALLAFAARAAWSATARNARGDRDRFATATDELAPDRRLQSFVVPEDQPQPLAPVISWNEGGWMPVRAYIEAIEPNITDQMTAEGRVRLVYSWKTTEFDPTCEVRQSEEVFEGLRAELPLFFESQDVIAILCMRGWRASNVTRAHIPVRRYPGATFTAVAIMVLGIGAILVFGVFTSLCLRDGAVFSTRGVLLAIYPSLALAFNVLAAGDYDAVGNGTLAAVVALSAFFSIGLDIFFTLWFWNFDLVYQRKVDYVFRRWTYKHMFQSFILGLFSAFTGVGCIKMLYSRLLRLWFLSPDFKPPPGFVPEGARLGPGGNSALVTANGGKPTTASVHPEQVDASGRPLESFHLDSPIPAHASWRLDVMQLLPTFVLHIPPMITASVLEGDRTWPDTNPLINIGVIAVNALGFLLWFLLLSDVITLNGPERWRMRRRYRALQLGGRRYGSYEERSESFEDRGANGRKGRGDEDEDDIESSDDDVTQVRKSRMRGAKGGDSSTVKGHPAAELKDEDVESYRHRAPGQPRDLLQRVDAEARAELARKSKDGTVLVGPAAGGKGGAGGAGGGANAKTPEETALEKRKRFWDQNYGLAGYGKVDADPDAEEKDDEEAARRRRLGLDDDDEFFGVPKKGAGVATAAAATATPTGTPGANTGSSKSLDAEPGPVAKFGISLASRINTIVRKVRGGGGGGGGDGGGAAAAAAAAAAATATPTPGTSSPGGAAPSGTEYEVEVEEEPGIPLPGGGELRGKRVRKIIPKVSTIMNTTASTAKYDAAVAANPFHPLNNTVAPGDGGLIEDGGAVRGEGGEGGAAAPRGYSSVRAALRAGRDASEALTVAAPAARRTERVPDPMTEIFNAVGKPGTNVGRAGASRAREGPGGIGAAVESALVAQDRALRQLNGLGRSDLVPNGKPRESDEESFDDDIR